MKKLILFSMFCACATVMDAQQIWYVEPIGTGNGSSWNSTVDLTTAVAQANSNDEIWVKEGDYHEWLSIPSNVKIYGGFGGTETSVSQRNPLLHETKLNAGSSVIAHPLRHIVSFYGVNNCLLDGFTIDGGGSIHTTGGGVFSSDAANIVLKNLKIRSCVGLEGGGAYIHSSSVWMENVIFENNYAVDVGGGLVISVCDDVTLANVLFFHNDTIPYDDSTITFTKRGGGFYVEMSTPVFYNLTVSDNNAMTNMGSGGYFDHSTGVFYNSVIYNDTIVLGVNASVTYYNCLLWKVTSSTPGSANFCSNPMFDPDLHLGQGSPCIDAGNNNYVPLSVTFDLDLNPRINGNSVDIGAYEFY